MADIKELERRIENLEIEITNVVDNLQMVIDSLRQLTNATNKQEQVELPFTKLEDFIFNKATDETPKD